MSEFEVRDLNPVLGAEISGIDLSQELDAETVARLRSTFDDRGVLVFRGLELAPEDQAYIAGLLVGATAPADRAAAEANSVDLRRAVLEQGRGWLRPDGPAALPQRLDVGRHAGPAPVALRARGGPAVGADHLREHRSTPGPPCPTALKARVEGLEAEQATGQRQRADDNDELLKATHEATRTTVKPIGWIHPRTGRPILYVSEMVTTRIMGMEPEASEELLQELFAHLYGDPANFYQHDWRVGDLLIWDNLATQHGRPNLTREAPERTLRKVIAPKPNFTMAKPKFEGASASS